MHRLRRLAPLAILLVVAGLLAACGGSQLASDPGKVLADAKLPAEGPAKSTLKAEFTPQGNAGGGATTTSTGDGAAGLLGALTGGPVAITATAQGDSAAASTVDAKITIGPVDAPVSIRTTTDNTYIQLNDQWYELGSSLGIGIGSITGAVGNVAQLIRDPKATAVEDVDGISCDRITGTIDPGASFADALGGLAANLPIDLSSLKQGTAQISVWVGRDDHTIHRVQIDTASAGDNASGGLMLDATTVPSDPVTVEAPADAKPISDLLGQLAGDAAGNGLDQLLGGLDLGQLLGGAGGLGGILGGSTSGAAT